MSNDWVERIREWGQAAIDEKPIIMDSLGREGLFDAALQSLLAKENEYGVNAVSPSSSPKLVLIPLSGGLDSLVAYERAVDLGHEVRSYYVNLRTPYAKFEYNVLKELGIQFEVIDHGNWPQRWEPYKTRWKHILPIRNLLIITSIAKQTGDRPGEIWLGATDGEIPASGGDKSLQFFAAADKVLNTFPVKHKLSFPLRHETKAELVAWWLETGRDPERLLTSITCQSPVSAWNENKPSSTYVACGECHACFNRWVALKANGLSEPLASDPRTIQANKDKVALFESALASSDFSTWSQRRLVQTLDAWNN